MQLTVYQGSFRPKQVKGNNCIILPRAFYFFFVECWLHFTNDQDLKSFNEAIIGSF